MKPRFFALGNQQLHSAALKQHPASRRIIGWISLFVVCLLLILYSFSQFDHIPLSTLTRDPADITGVPFYVGILSTLGVMLWSAATGICAVGLLLLEPSHPQRRFLAASALLSGLLTLDDAILLHERVFPVHLHIPENLVLAGYLGLGIAYLYYFLPRMLSTDYGLFLIAAGFMGLSIVFDVIMPFHELATFTEDSLKFIGIVFWLSYFGRTVQSILAHAKHQS
ncbi:hypothetical protein [Herpetosiphon sp. NSE202]|uniref:hypothetical protein n=1 Tax=Herpetosiphon sp. NSE202 TaxID=3351349 RepID=UPI0036430169